MFLDNKIVIILKINNIYLISFTIDFFLNNHTKGYYSFIYSTNIYQTSTVYQALSQDPSYKGDYDTDHDEDNGVDTKRCSCKFQLQPRGSATHGGDQSGGGSS